MKSTRLLPLDFMAIYDYEDGPHFYVRGRGENETHEYTLDPHHEAALFARLSDRIAERERKRLKRL